MTYTVKKQLNNHSKSFNIIYYWNIIIIDKLMQKMHVKSIEKHKFNNNNNKNLKFCQYCEQLTLFKKKSQSDEIYYE